MNPVVDSFLSDFHRRDTEFAQSLTERILFPTDSYRKMNLKNKIVILTGF